MCESSTVFLAMLHDQDCSLPQNTPWTTQNVFCVTCNIDGAGQALVGPGNSSQLTAQSWISLTGFFLWVIQRGCGPC